MRISVEGDAGDLAASPEKAFSTLLRIAVADGADEGEWVAKALASVGATRMGVPVRRDPRYQVVADAVQQSIDVYHRAMALMREAIRDVLDTQVRSLGFDLHKASVPRKPTRLITPEMMRRIQEIIRTHHVAVAAVMFGKDAVSSEDWKLAQALGVVSAGDDAQGITERLHTCGAFLAHLTQAAATERYGTTLAEFEDHIKKHPIPQTRTEHHAAQYTAARGAQAIVGLGNRVGATLGSALIEADKAQDERLRGIMRDAVASKFGDEAATKRLQAVGADKGLSDEFFHDQFRKTVRQVASDIGHATDDWTRDVYRIAQTETHTAVQEGIKESWLETEDEQAKAQGRAPRRILVFKLPRPDACKHCIELHLDAGVPRIFYLDELQANGTNVGRKAADWRPVVGSVHPHCACVLSKVPALAQMPVGWHSGEAAPGVIGPGGRLVMS